MSFSGRPSARPRVSLAFARGRAAFQALSETAPIFLSTASAGVHRFLTRFEEIEDARRGKALDDLAAEAQKLNLGY